MASTNIILLALLGFHASTALALFNCSIVVPRSVGPMRQDEPGVQLMLDCDDFGEDPNHCLPNLQAYAQPVWINAKYQVRALGFCAGPRFSGIGCDGSGKCSFVIGLYDATGNKMADTGIVFSTSEDCHAYPVPPLVIRQSAKYYIMVSMNGSGCAAWNLTPLGNFLTVDLLGNIPSLSPQQIPFSDFQVDAVACPTYAVVDPQ